MLKNFSDHLQTKKICKNTSKKLSFVIMYVPDQYKEPYIKYVGGGGPEGFCGGHETF